MENEDKLDVAMDEHLSGKANPEEETSSSKETTVIDADETKPAVTDTEKTETGEVKEDEVPKEFHKHPAWQRILKQRDEALEKLKGTTTPQIKPEDVEQFNQVVNSPAYIRESMKAQGYKDEAIDAVLKEKGFEVAEKPDDTMGLIFSKLGVDPNAVDDNTKAIVKDVASIFDIMFEERFGKRLPKEIEPVKQYIEQTNREKMALHYSSEMERIVEEEGILDFDKDIAPVLLKYFDDNEEKFKSGELNQPDAFKYFIDLNHKLSIERLKTGKRKEERDNLKGQNRPAGKGERTFTELPNLTGDFEKDLETQASALLGRD